MDEGTTNVNVTVVTVVVDKELFSSDSLEALKQLGSELLDKWKSKDKK